MPCRFIIALALSHLLALSACGGDSSDSGDDGTSDAGGTSDDGSSDSGPGTGDGTDGDGGGTGDGGPTGDATDGGATGDAGTDDGATTDAGDDGSGDGSSTDGGAGGLCDVLEDDQACAVCMKEECCPAYTACQNNEGCACMLQCIRFLPPDEVGACQAACANVDDGAVQGMNMCMLTTGSPCEGTCPAP